MVCPVQSAVPLVRPSLCKPTAAEVRAVESSLPGRVVGAFATGEVNRADSQGPVQE